MKQITTQYTPSPAAEKARKWRKRFAIISAISAAIIAASALLVG
ncbi:hypothetical protein QG053_10555 [Kingella kingae]|nr:hypothetical protein [Kingella kingae]MDK4565465.1 hypothetical protein [Kingella kingae]